MTTIEPREAAGSGSSGVLHALRRGAEQKLTNMVDMIRFFGEVFAAIPRTVQFSSEVFRQIGILILSSGFVIVFIQLVSGYIFANQGHYIMHQIGAAGYVTFFPVLGGLRLSVPQMAGWILSAKVGCGLVAEIGSARISDEIDALEVMGVNSKVYMVATRVVAAIVVMPFLFVIGLFLYYLGAYLANVHVLHSVSEGGFFTVLWVLQNSTDMIYSLIIALACGITVVLVGCYYGYNASGGPVGVGLNTAKSMVVNILLVSVIGLALATLFWGSTPNLPISN